MPVSPSWYILSGILVVIVVATLTLLPAVSSPQGTDGSLTCPPLPENDALAMDAQYYAADFGVSVEEAICRLTVQEEIGYLGATLNSHEPDTYGGLWIYHEPEFGVTVLFTEDPAATLQPYVKDSPLAGIVRARKARASLRSLEQAQRRAHDIVGATGIPIESGINVSQNRVELYAIDVRELKNALKNAGSRLPGHVALIEVQQHSSPAS